MEIDELNLSQIMVPLANWLKAVADEVRSGPNDEAVVGAVLNTLHLLKIARNLDDNERIARLEALVMSLATWIYREKQAEFEQFVSESAEIVVLDALIKMRDSATLCE